jgi:hypothetical protein
MFWMMEVVLYQIYAWGGAALVVFVQSMVILGAYGLVLVTCLRASRSWRMAAFCTLFAAALGLNDWNVRPQSITFLLGAIFLWTIQSERRKPDWRLVFIFPLGMMIWVNSHGTFPLGLALIGLWGLDATWFILARRIESGEPLLDLKPLFIPGIALLLSLLACMANPKGVEMINYVKDLTGNPVVQSLVTEWAPPTFATLGGSLFLAGLLISAMVLSISPDRPQFFELMLFIVFAVLGLRTQRGSVWYGICMAPVLANHLPPIANQILQFLRRIWKSSPVSVEKGSYVVNIVFMVILLGMAVISLPWFKHLLPLPPAKAGLISAETPVSGTEYLIEQKFPPPLFHAMSFGSYLIWAAQPEYPVFVDPRIELYSAQTWREYIFVSNALADNSTGGWQAILDHYGVQTLLLSPQEQPALIQAVQKSPGWQEQYRDQAAVIFTRR